MAFPANFRGYAHNRAMLVLTAFVIVMEMVDGHALVLSLMASVMVASVVSRLISAPLYPSLAELQLLRIKRTQPPGTESAP